MTTQHYAGSCHCGAVAFEADVDLEKTITCNCSRCQRLGAVLTFAPRSALAIKSGEDALTAYTFNKHRIRHMFCRTCGIEPFAFADGPDGAPGAAINVNCLEGVEPRGLASHAFDGRSK